MNVVEGCNRQQIERVKSMLDQRYARVYGDIWRVGINLTLRISDLLRIKFSDLDMINRRLDMVESKTGKKKEIRLNESASKVINQRRKDYPEDIWLFEPHGKMHKRKAVDRSTVSRVFKEAGEWLGLTINTHSMRKTRGLILYHDGVPLEKIAMVLNHSSTAETLRYIGITREQVLETFTDYEL